MAKFEITESYTREQFARRLRALADALEMSAGYRLLLPGREVIIPTTAKRWEIEYEADQGRHEVEFIIKWGPRVEKEEKRETVKAAAVPEAQEAAVAAPVGEEEVAAAPEAEEEAAAEPEAEAAVEPESEQPSGEAVEGEAAAEEPAGA